jgi:hypothetical protein
MSTSATSTPAFLGRGILAGLGGTVVMTVFQLLVEMPLSGRPESDAPAQFAEKVLSRGRSHGKARRRVNYASHMALGTLWGSAYGVAARSGLRGQRAVAPVFATVYASDVLLNTALGLYRPSTWTRRDVAVDVLDKLVQAQATGWLFDRFLTPGGAAR